MTQTLASQYKGTIAHFMSDKTSETLENQIKP